MKIKFVSNVMTLTHLNTCILFVKSVEQSLTLMMQISKQQKRLARWDKPKSKIFKLFYTEYVKTVPDNI